MDRYKFRGKRLDNGEWVYGCYSFLKLGIGDLCQHYIIVDGYTPVEVDPATVGQYTTLNDNQQNELYDGDIAKHITAGWTGVISFKDGAYRISNGIGTWDLLRSRAYRLLKVGNVTDNPELLEG